MCAPMYTYICVNACMCDVYGYMSVNMMWMYVCMFVYMRLGVCICRYVCMSICIYVYIMCVCIYVYMYELYVCVYVFMYMYIWVCICVYMYIYVYVYMYIYVCVCVYVCIGIYTYTKFFIRFAVQYLLTFHSTLPYYNSVCWCWTTNRNVYSELTQEDVLLFSQNTFLYLYICILNLPQLRLLQVVTFFTLLIIYHMNVVMT